MREEPKSSTDWAATLEALEQGDALALAKLTRLVNGFLGRWNAYDFRSDWDDLIQEVLMGAVLAMREGRIRERSAVAGYLRSTARFKFADRLKRHLRCSEDQTLPWENVIGEDELQSARDPKDLDLQQDLVRALESLDEKRRIAVIGVHVQGQTYAEVAEESGIPFGSLKRYLREGLAQLREELDTFLARE
jgi:RNA polymerase sigma-70 factor (ECF subfamily)